MTPVTRGTPVSPESSDIPCADGSATPEARGAGFRLPARLARRGVAGAVLGALWLLCGCGGLGFTGGSIPPGGTRLAGRVAAAENPYLPLSNAVIQVTSRPITGGVRTLTTTSASDGTFLFPRVPTGSTTTSMTVTVTPESSQGRQSQTVAFSATNAVDDDLVVSLPLNTFDIALPASIDLQSVTAVSSGGSATIHALLLESISNPSGNPTVTRLPAEPTLLYSGNFGSIAIDDTFVATPGVSGAFTGTLMAFWYNLPPATTSVTEVPFDPGAPPPPPALPDLPPGATPVRVPQSVFSSRAKH